MCSKEIRDNVLRLQSHPSIALWAGNNEDERDMKNAPVGRRGFFAVASDARSAVATTRKSMLSLSLPLLLLF